MRRRRWLAAAVTAIAGALVVGTAGTAWADLPVTSTEDVTGPRITSVTIDPVTVDVTNGSKTLTVTVTATDDLSGVDWMALNYGDGNDNNHEIDFSVWASDRIAGDALNGTYRTTVTVDTSKVPGTYSMFFFEIFDVVGNIGFYRPSDHIGPDALTVVNNSVRDTTPPTATSVAISPNPVDVSSGTAIVTVDVTGTDDISSPAYLNGYLESPSGRQSVQFSGGPRTGVPGTLRGLTHIPKYSEAGDWHVIGLCIRDQAGNDRCYNSQTTPPIGTLAPDALHVLSQPVDATPPVVPAFRVSPGAIDVTSGAQTVTTSIDVSDELSGVAYVSLTWTSPRTAGALPEVLTRDGQAFSQVYTTYSGGVDTWTAVEDDSKRLHLGTLKATTTFPRYDRSGTWTLTRLCVDDNVEWRTCYTPTSTPSLADLGPTDLTVTWNRTPVVSVTGVSDSTYVTGSEPTPGCAVSDVEDGTPTVAPTVTGPDANGVVTVTCSYTDTGGLTSGATRTYTVVKPANTPPTVSLSGVDQPVYNQGAEPTPSCAVSDAEDGTPTVAPSISRSDADHVVTVTCSYTDAGGLTATASRTYTVNTPPSVAVLGVSSGSYEYGTVPAAGCAVSDAEDASPSAVPVVGPVTGPLASYGLGDVTVSCSYTDSGGLSAMASTTYRVVDTTAPALRLPAAVTTPATGASGATVGYSADATDAVDAHPTTTCSPPSGSVLPIGTTTVSCRATDVSGNSSTGSFPVTVTPACVSSTGLQAPINADGSSVFKIGSTIPVKTTLLSCYGVTPDQVRPQVHLTRLDTSADGTVNQVVSSAAADDGTTMRYAGPGHIYNLSTKLSQFCASAASAYCLDGALTEGTYRITITAPELPTPVTGTFNLRD